MLEQPSPAKATRLYYSERSHGAIGVDESLVEGRIKKELKAFLNTIVVYYDRQATAARQLADRTIGHRSSGHGRVLASGLEAGRRRDRERSRARQNAFRGLGRQGAREGRLARPAPAARRAVVTLPGAKDVQRC
jgi:hypothetical protein